MPLLFVRHGESEGNQGRFVQGWMDVALTERGRAEAAAVARRLAREPVAAIYSSTLLRAHDTALAIAAHHGLEVERLDGLKEQGYGEAEGLNWNEIARRWPMPPEGWGMGQIPGEEGRVTARRRVASTLDTLLDRHEDDLAVCVSHGGAIAHAVAHVMDLPPEVQPRLRIGNCSLTIFARQGGMPVILGLNDVCHLDVVSGVSDVTPTRLRPD